jgi:hypothetical protein
MGDVTRRTFVLGTALAGGALAAPAAAKTKPKPRKKLAPSGPPTLSIRDGHLVGDNGRLRVVIDGTSGGIRSVENLHTGQHLLAPPSGAPKPWRMAAQSRADEPVNLPATVKNDASADDFPPRNFRHAIAAGGQEALLTWDTGTDGLTVDARVVLHRGGDLELWPAVRNRGAAAPPKTLTYPLLLDLAELSPGGAQDELIHPSQSTGYLYRRPFERTIPNISEFYPDGYSGLSMQVMGYYAHGKGGFSLASHDPHATSKYIHFARDEVSWRHVSWDLRGGADLPLDYPVVIAPMTRGDWYEVAEHYRAWALRQPWCAAGPKHSRSDDQYARWLHEEVGATLWAVPSQTDWSPWVKFYGELAGKLQIVPAYDWSATRSWQKGFDGYFPAKFHPNNIKAFAEHRVTPYVNPLFVSEQAKDFATLWEPPSMKPLTPADNPFPLGIFCYTTRPRANEAKSGQADPRVAGDLVHFICPATPAQKSLHEWRDRTLIEQTGFDGVQYDIGIANPENWDTCHDASHGHPPGTGRWVNDHYLENTRRSKEAMSKVLGRYAVQGCETINETNIGLIDCFFSRVVAGPHTVAEGRSNWGAPFETTPGGPVEAVPFFDAVYHDHGPVRQDGYAQLNPGYGDAFYWIAARQVLLFGGLLDLDYNVYWPEAFPGYTGSPEATYTPYDGGYWTPYETPEYDAAKGDFVREVAKARTGFGNPWLGYGRVARPVGVKSPTIGLDYGNHRDVYPWNDQAAQGTWHVPQVSEAAWFDKHDRLGLFFTNLAKDRSFPLTVDVDAGERWGRDLRGCRLRLAGSDGERIIGKVGKDNHVRFKIDLAPRKVACVAVLRKQRRRS